MKRVEGYKEQVCQHDFDAPGRRSVGEILRSPLTTLTKGIFRHLPERRRRSTGRSHSEMDEAEERLINKTKTEQLPLKWVAALFCTHYIKPLVLRMSDSIRLSDIFSFLSFFRQAPQRFGCIVDSTVLKLEKLKRTIPFFSVPKA